MTLAFTIGVAKSLHEGQGFTTHDHHGLDDIICVIP